MRAALRLARGGDALVWPGLRGVAGGGRPPGAARSLTLSRSLSFPLSPSVLWLSRGGAAVLLAPNLFALFGRWLCVSNSCLRTTSIVEGTQYASILKVFRKWLENGLPADCPRLGLLVLVCRLFPRRWQTFDSCKACKRFESCWIVVWKQLVASCKLFERCVEAGRDLFESFSTLWNYFKLFERRPPSSQVARTAKAHTCVCSADVCTKDTLVDASAPGNACAVGTDGALDHSIQACPEEPLSPGALPRLPTAQPPQPPQQPPPPGEPRTSRRCGPARPEAPPAHTRPRRLGL